MATLNKEAERQLRVELARRDFWEYCKIRIPKQYKESREYLKDFCHRLQDFGEQNEKQVLVVNMGPRFAKSLTGQLYTEWQFGKNPSNTVMTGSYNEDLASLFSKTVRNSIQTVSRSKAKICFQDIFPDVKISRNDASVNMWRIEGSPTPSYLATSPGGTAVGLGCNLLIIDDLVKNAKEALSESHMTGLAEWVFNTMLTRLEGNDWKIVVIMQRFSTLDIAGQFLKDFDCVHVNYPAYTINEDGTKTFLCPEVLDEKSWAIKAHRMAPEIERAVYLQDPLDVQGRMYHEFNTYNQKEVYPSSGEIVYAVTDTADRGKDYLCTGIYLSRDGTTYMLDYVLSQSPMEITERLVAEKFDKWRVSRAFTEANNGGRGFARNVRRLMKNRQCVFSDKIQTTNKDSRIINSSGWVQNNVWFPDKWEFSWRDIYEQIMSYVRNGDNLHDDAVDMLAYVYEMETTNVEVTQTQYVGERAFPVDDGYGFSLESEAGGYGYSQMG